MMNLVTLGLLLSSLAAAGVWSPHHEPKPRHHQQRHPADDQVLREGHRVVVVEYERQVPPDFAEQVLHPPATHRLIEEAKDKIQEAASVLPDLGQGVSTPPARPDEAQAAGSAKSMICDAYGVCKEKVAGLVGKSKEKATEIEDISKDAVKKAGEKPSQLKEGAQGAVRDAEEKASQLKESAKDTVKETIDAAKEKASMARDKLESTIDKASQIKEDTKDAMEKVVESAEETGQDISRNISGIAKRVEHRAEKTARETRGNLTDILRRAKEVAFDAAVYVWAPETGQAAAAILHLLGFATAYGACVWVTFVSGNVLATALPRQQFGLVQSKLYPVYFRLVAYSTALTLVAHFLGRDRRILAERVQGYNLLGALVLVLVNMFFLEPKATKVMFERMKIEKEEGRGRDMADVMAEPPVMASAPAGTTTTTTAAAATRARATSAAASVEQDGEKCGLVHLNRRLKKLNTYSSFLNLLTLMSLSWHQVHLARQLPVSC
ncbi:Transmembrane protein 205 [Musa troglodytarum]|uniref:Transmembrane protein 205 n=1 Tax=Musa troglodytarum TaxID=320322 RepID=A0A9E7KMB0_9LILI|nr:Transmembrane protein 205 [Musa troglodytarum]